MIIMTMIRTALGLASRILRITVVIVFAILDMLIALIFIRWIGERKETATNRISFSDTLKDSLYKKQDGRCFYCGVKRNHPEFDIDHMYPVARGGSNEEWNLQLLCRPCNLRKSIHTDEEFSERYKTVLGYTKRPANPPTTVIPQEKFEKVEKATKPPKTVWRFRNSKKKSPIAKFVVGSLILEIIVILAWYSILDVVCNITDSLGLESSFFICRVLGIVLGILLICVLYLRSLYQGRFKKI